MDRKGFAYHYLDEGRGDPMVMVHGNPTWSFYFRRLVAAFREEHRVIAPDHLGCGLSDKPTPGQYGFRLRDRVDDLAALLDTLVPNQPVTLVVHDWGGMIGLAWALEHPRQVRRIVITNTAGFFPPRSKSIPLRLKLIRTPNPLMDLLVLRFNLFARAAIHMAPRRRLAPDVKAGLLAPYDCPAHRWATLKFVQDIPLSVDDPSGELVARVSAGLEEICNCPVLLLWGANDFVFDPDYFRQWRRRLPGAQTHFFEDAGHYLFEDAPGPCIDRIKDFLRNQRG
jgi:pimeloyl-ACP methyl ester carboxylesterase